MNLKKFLSVLLVYRSNFQVLHWMVKGKQFFRLHAKADEYVSMLTKDIDVVAEMSLRLDDSVVNYVEAIKCIEEDEDRNFILVDGNKLVGHDKFCECAQKMFESILECIEELLETEEIKNPKNVGIKSSLEAMHNEYDLQYRYLIKRYMD